MAITTTYPGVYVQEVASGVTTITGVSTSVAAFIGMVNQGPLDEPTRVLSYADYERSFGSDTSASEMTDQVKQFFLNGGQQGYVMRIAHGAIAAAVTLQNETGAVNVLDLVARDAGTIGDAIRIEIDYDTSSPESTFNLTAYRLVSNGSGGTEREDEEVFTELSMNPNNARYAVTILSQQSTLLDVPETYNDGPATGTAFAGYAIAGLIGSDADLRNAALAVIPAGESRDFRISIDGGPFVTVSLAEGDVTAAAGLVDPLETAINNAHLSYGTSVDVSVANDHLIIESNLATGGSVRLRQGTTADIAEALHLGLDRGGLEVDGYAAARPGPNGLFQSLGDITNPATLANSLNTLGTRAPADIAGYQLTDALGTHTETSAFTYAGPTLCEDAAGEESLGQLQASLDQIVTRINADAADDDTFSWKAERIGFRIVLTPEFGNSDTTATAFATTPIDLGFVLNAAEYRFNGNVGLEILGAPGDNGTAPQAGDYEDAFEIVEREVDLFNLMILPRASDQDDTAMDELWGIASAFCEEQRAFLIVDPRRSWSTVDDVDDEIIDVRTGVTTDHAAIYWPRLAISDSGVIRYIDPSGSMAGLMARTDSSRGVWKAPAGMEATISGVRGLEHSLSDRENGIINPQAVNAMRLFPAGVVSWGARTMVGYDNSGNDDYKYVPVRRLALFLEESLYRGLQFAVFEPNDEPLWGQIRLAAGAFMNNLFRQGAFFGQKSSDAYFVKCDSETTTQNDINLGICNVIVGFAPLKPAEFIIITIKQRAGEVSV